MARVGLLPTALLDFLKGVHAPGDIYKLALIRDLSDIPGAFLRYADLGAAEVQGDGYAPGGIELTDYYAALVNEHAGIGWAPAQWPKATISAAGGVIYNWSKGGAAIQVLDFGEVFGSKNGPFTVELSRVDQIRLMPLEAARG